MRRNTKLIIQGVTGSFHDEAARQYFGNSRVDILPARSFHELARKLDEDHSIHYGVMAIENSIAGSILQNYRLLREHSFWICGEIYLRIRLNLLGLKGQTLDQIKEVRSHPMALYQCLDFLKKNPHIRLTETEDTASSAQEISEQNLQGVAAIGAGLAAELYGLDIMAEGIETSQVNYTRFAVVSREDEYSSMRNADKASIYLRVSHKYGSLLKVLEKIADHKINISKLQSFPVLGEINTYYFHLDLEFDDISQYESCMDEVRKVSSHLDELGVYKKATIYDHHAV